MRLCALLFPSRSVLYSGVGPLVLSTRKPQRQVAELRHPGFYNVGRGVEIPLALRVGILDGAAALAREIVKIRSRKLSIAKLLRN